MSATTFAVELERDILPAARHALRSLPDADAVAPEERADLEQLRKVLIGLDGKLMELTRALHTKDRQQIDRALDQLRRVDP
jgi:hypothetical protein